MNVLQENNCAGHQPFITTDGVYYCTTAGTDENGAAEWRVTFNGVTINSGERIVDGTTVECSPHVEYSDGVYTLSFVTRFSGGGYYLVIVTSNTPGFTSLTSTRVVGPVPIGSIICDGRVLTIETDGTGFVASSYSLDDEELTLMTRRRVEASFHSQFMIVKASCIHGTGGLLLMTCINPFDQTDYFSIAVDLDGSRLSSPLLDASGGNIYKSSYLGGKLVHAVKGDHFEDRTLCEEDFDLDNLTWSDVVITDFTGTESFITRTIKLLK